MKQLEKQQAGVEKRPERDVQRMTVHCSVPRQTCAPWEPWKGQGQVLTLAPG